MPNKSVNNTPVPPNLAEFLARRMRDISSRLNCHLIGEIVTFDATKQTAVVKVNFLKTFQNVNPLGDTGETSDVIVEYPLLVDVPIIIMQGGGGYLTFPIVPGDQCLLLFCDRDMDNWFQNGLTVTPNSNRVHDLNDAIALVGLNNLQNAMSDYSGSNVELRFGNTYIRIFGGAYNVASVFDGHGERLPQSGFLQPYAGSSAPSGWLLCYGQAVNRVGLYAQLFAVIGTTYGAGNGTTTFNLPDLRGRVPVGLDNMGGSNANVLTNTYNPNRNTLGGAIGEEAHQLTIAELALHNHQISGAALLWQAGSNQIGIGSTSIAQPSGSTGGDVPHQNVQPGRMFNWLIKI